ncbi:hypothetical protein ACKUB1_12445 [Methanospirillum stamsii]|uniref:Uncharacterized protein n=1 Tax=Methanospirillum stamsii TaxID=1277351 RepID=A0A2V2N644_9EURY|nr:hypothetical protein [Methanospirillum stamsii]PWR75564.1 hypothetical protein DLD82_04145 [Methanospirillum stamsii]
MELTLTAVLMFILALIVSAVIIYLITKFFGETEDIKTAIIAALVGTIIYTIIYAIIGQGLIAAFIAGIVWLIALQKLYSIGWMKSLLIAVVIWIVTSVVGLVLPVI